MNTEDDKGQEFKIGVSWAVAIWIVVLTLAVWIFFRIEHMPLDPAGTAVVALTMTIIVVGGKWLWSRARQSSHTKAPEVKK